MGSLQKESEWEKELKKSFLKELDFLSDHWVNGDDKPPFSFGGWREEVANEFVKIAKTAVSQRENEIAEEVKKERLNENDSWDISSKKVLQIIKH